MRRFLTVLFALSALLSLCAGTALAQVTFTLTPQGPLTLAPGGSLSLLLSVTNDGDESVFFSSLANSVGSIDIAFDDAAFQIAAPSVSIAPSETYTDFVSILVGAGAADGGLYEATYEIEVTEEISGDMLAASDTVFVTVVAPSVVPEPATLALFALPLIGLAV